MQSIQRSLNFPSSPSTLHSHFLHPTIVRVSLPSMESTGDEGIMRKFFRDLERLYSEKPEADDLLRAVQNLGLNPNQIDAFSDDSKGLSRMQSPIRPVFVPMMCKYGPLCKLNHPVLKKIMDDWAKNYGDGFGSSSKIPQSQIPCKFYSSGLCKYGKSCRFNHSKSEAEKSPLQLNIFGYPKRLGTMNCSFYLRTGMCGYGASCKFHHPDPIMVSDPEPMNNHKEAFETTGPYLSFGRIRVNMSPYLRRKSASSGDQAPKCKQKVETAEDYIPKIEPCVLNDVGLPIRPGKKVCLFYEHLDICSFGPACVFDHPKKHSSTHGSTSASPSGVKSQESGTPQK